eukprot:m.41996 g.41996  ORF g.41996 m.41996 type:complete len:76 (+) comp12846_c0_seq1:431-658(+)
MITPSKQQVQPTKPPSVADLVTAAYDKNQQLSSEFAQCDVDLRRAVLQRRLWGDLRRQFFAPDANPDALALQSAV